MVIHTITNGSQRGAKLLEEVQFYKKKILTKFIRLRYNIKKVCMKIFQSFSRLKPEDLQG